MGGGGAAREHREGGKADLGDPPLVPTPRPSAHHCDPGHGARRGGVEGRARRRRPSAERQRTQAGARREGGGQRQPGRHQSPDGRHPPRGHRGRRVTVSGGAPAHSRRPGRERAGGRGRTCAVARGSRSARQGGVVLQWVSAASDTVPVPPRGGVTGRRAGSRLPRSAALRYGLWKVNFSVVRRPQRDSATPSGRRPSVQFSSAPPFPGR